MGNHCSQILIVADEFETTAREKEITSLYGPFAYSATVNAIENLTEMIAVCLPAVRSEKANNLR